MNDFQENLAKEKEVSTDMWAVAHLLTSPHWNSSKEQADELSSVLVGYESTYGRDLMRDIEDMIRDVIGAVCDRIAEGEEA